MVLCLVTQSSLTLCDPRDCSPPGSSVHGILQARILEWVASPPPGDLPNPGIEPRYPALQADSVLSEPPGKPMDTGVSSLALLWGSFLTQESNWGRLHCRVTLYQLNYPRNPRPTIGLSIMKVKCKSVSRSVMSNSLQPHGL